ncbi:MAG TPA: hypothetical protein VKV27_01490 [Solirubrobacteraceae bacterium]|nr:hypothetical protein [Solirubrobacteraceae bacterium]
MSPAVGGPATVFEFSFTMPVSSASTTTTASSPSLEVAASARPGCVSAHAQSLGRSPAGASVRARLGPAQLGGRWCAGEWTARVVQLVRARCPAGEMCPQFIRLVAIAGPAGFRVRP